MAEVHTMYEEATALLYQYNKTKLIVWLNKTENMIIFENFINLLKEKMVDIYDNVSNFTTPHSLKVSMNYFKSEFEKPKSRRGNKAQRKSDEAEEIEASQPEDIDIGEHDGTMNFQSFIWVVWIINQNKMQKVFAEIQGKKYQTN